MEQWLELIIRGVIFLAAGLFLWKVYPLIKDNAIYKKALEIVHQMEEAFGAGQGEIKFATAVELLQNWADKLGWKIDVRLLAEVITSAVGVLHAQQGKVPTQPKQTDEEIVAELLAEDK